MTKRERLGLDIAKDLLRKNVLLGDNSKGTDDPRMAAIKWIDRQQGIDQRRRKPRGEYIGDPR